MKFDKEAGIGCFMLASLFLGFFFVLPYAASFGIYSDNFSSRVIFWIIIAVLLLILIFAVPEMMFVWFGIPILAFVFAWIFLGDSSGNCVPIVPGSCD